MQAYIKIRTDEIIIRNIKPGSCSLIGLRIIKLVIESSEEVHYLLEPKGQLWLKDQVHRFIPKPAKQVVSPIDTDSGL